MIHLLDRTSKIRPFPMGVSIGHYCFDEKTVLMTKNGFKGIDEITYDDYVATLNPISKELEWEKPKNIFKYDYEGEMVHFESYSVDLMVTPNHRVYTRVTKRRKDFEIVLAKELIGKKEFEFLKTAKWNCQRLETIQIPTPKGYEEDTKLWNEVMKLHNKGYGWRRIPKMINASASKVKNWTTKGNIPWGDWKNLKREIPVDVWFKFMGWFLSEGYASHHEIVLSQSRVHPDNRSEIISLIKKLGFKPFVGKKDNHIAFCSIQIAEYLHQFGKAHEKFVPEYIKNAPPDQIRIFLDALFKGDGCFVRGCYKKSYMKKWHGRWFSYVTTSKRLAEDVCELLLKVGLSFHLIEIPAGKPNHSKQYRVHVINKYLSPRIMKPPKMVHYKGRVWCVETNNGIVLAIRNGKPVWTGNSITAGTAGCIVEDKSGREYILSNNHVLANSNDAKVGDPIYQPGCYSEDTRVLTKRGFIYFYEVSGDDEILTFNLDSGELEWQKPLKIHKYPYTGPMVQFSGQMYDLLVTPNHNMVIRRYGDNKWFLVTAEEILRRQFRSRIQELERARDLILKGYGRKRLSREFGKRAGGWAQKLIRKVKHGLPLAKKGIAHATLELPKTGIWRCSDLKEFKIGDCCIPIDEWLQFLGFWLAEGSVCKDKKGGYKILLRNFDFTKLQHMAQLLKKWGFSPNISKYGQLEFFSKQLFLWLSGNCFTKPYDSLPKGRKAYYKRVPPAFKELPPERLKVLLTWLFKGDGCFEGEKFRRYTTSSKRLAEDVAEIALKCGYVVSIREERGLYYVGISNRNITPRITKQPTTVHYDGYVYCLTVPNHTMVVERNGKVSICGNSYDGGTLEDKVAELYDFVEVKFADSSSTCTLSNFICRCLNLISRLFRRKTRFYTKVDFIPSNEVDCAIALPTTNEYKPEICEIGLPKGSARAQEGDTVYKSGRTTGLTVGVVVDDDMSITVSYGDKGVALFEHQILVKGEKFIQGGDSGSALLNDDDYVVGLCFAGSMDGSYGIANHIFKVEELLNVKVKGFN